MAIQRMDLIQRISAVLGFSKPAQRTKTKRSVSHPYPRYLESGDDHSPSRGEPPVLSSHFMKSMSLTSCSARTSATETFTTLFP